MVRGLFSKYILFYILFITVFAYFLRDAMITEILAEVQIYEGKQLLLLPVLIFIVVSFYLFTKNDIVLKSQALKQYSLTVLLLYLISVSYATFMPLSTRSLYFSLILPCFVLYIAYKASLYIKRKEVLIVSSQILLILLSYTFYENFQFLLFSLNSESWVSNSAYSVLYLLPLTLCAKNKWLRILSIILVFITIISCSKRGGFIGLSLGLCVYIFVQRVLLSEKKKLLRIVVVLLFLLATGIYIFEYLLNSDLIVMQRMSAIDETGGSGRLQIWMNTLNMISNSDILSLFFGHGYNSVVLDSPERLSAHNDFLEIFYDFGVIVFISYFILHIRIIQLCKKMIEVRSSYAAPLAFSYVIFFVSSMVSHIFIYPNYMAIFALVFGGIYGLYKREQLSIEDCAEAFQ